MDISLNENKNEKVEKRKLNKNKNNLPKTDDN